MTVSPCCRLACLCVSLLPVLAGCDGSHSRPERVWGRKGIRDGEFVKPRAVAVDKQDRLYIVDFTARIQVFDRKGNYLGPTWTTPDYRNGRPSGLSIDRDGNLLVSDSHYHCLRIYSPDGKELRKIGGQAGTGPGQFGYISDAVQDEDGYYYVAEFGENQRLSKLDPYGRFVTSWGAPGKGPGEFNRVRALTFRPNDPEHLLYCVDACNDRVQVFTRDGQLVRLWGESGEAPGQLAYPYDLAFSPKGDVLYVLEWGNCRVQKFTPEGQWLGCWGGKGLAPGQLQCPWALAVDSEGYVQVIDSENHRVQRIAF
jgi:DNA-binding beta-propeller fold protein YncE